MTLQLRPLIFAALAVAPPAQAQQPPTAAQSAPAPPFIPATFHPPTLVETAGFKLVPLGPALVRIDYDAYMSSIEHLQSTFTRSTDWPHAGITATEAMRDMEGEQARFRARRSFAYSVLTPDGKHERGCVYVSPSPVPGHDAAVRLWVTKGEYESGFDAELYAWVKGWIAKDWPFTKVAYPGRAIDWVSCDAAARAVRKPVATE